MGLFGFLFGGKKNPTIWTLDVYIEHINGAVKDLHYSAEETKKYLKRLGEEIGATYGITGIQHAWRAASLTDDRIKLCAILKIEWDGLNGWVAADALPPRPPLIEADEGGP
jgi:hypothetical protein